MIDFEKIRFKNFLSYGNQFTEIKLNKAATNLIQSPNGYGKCLRGNTEIEIRFKTPEFQKLYEDWLSEQT